MESIDSSGELDIDVLAETLKSNSEFKKLLKNRTFNDYLNTFLSLPVFAVRVLYRRDNGQFELEQPISRTSHHLIEENIVNWVRINRGELFLKTTICNEYRLCATLQEMPVCLNIDGFDKDELAKFQLKYMAKVIDMQRLKGYMQGTIGDSLISFWLDAERFRRQVEPNCRRFVIKEIYSKYLIDGATYELNHTLREKIQNNLKELWVERDKRGERPTIAGTVLVQSQQMVLESLQGYWIPKYVQHRLKRRGLIKNRWAKALSIREKLLKASKKSKFADIVQQLKEKENSEKKEKGIAEEVEAETNALFSTEITPSEKKLSTDKDNKEERKGVEESPENDDRRRSSTNDKGELFKRVLERKEKKVEEGDETEECIVSNSQDQLELEEENIFEEIIDTKIPEPENQSTDQTFFNKPLFPEIVSAPKKSSRRRTFFEAVHREYEYEADTEDEDQQDENSNDRKKKQKLKLPLIDKLSLISKSFITNQMDLPESPTKFQQQYPSSFIKHNLLIVMPDDEYSFSCLLAALTTDQAAGQPLLDYFQKTNNKVGESNLKFWTASNDILSDCRKKIDPVIRQKQYQAIIHMHLSEYSDSEVSLSQKVKEELCMLLPEDAGVTRLMNAANDVATKLMPLWDEFMKHDKRTFLKKTTKLKRKITLLPSMQRYSLLPSAKKDLPKIEDISREGNESYDEEYEFDGTLPPTLENVQQRDMDAQAFNVRRMWRAMELAIAISRPKHTEIIQDVDENGKWTTDESEESDDDDINTRDERVAGSLALKSLEYINEKAERLKKLEALFNKRHHSLAHDYLGVNLLRDIDKDLTDEEYFKIDDIPPKEVETSNVPPRPRCFQDVFTDSIQFEHFKKYLTKEKEETPLLFWAAVENMRTSSRTAKARQGRTHGIVKRFFGSQAGYGKDLKCNADIIKEIPHTDQVTPTMLFSAQACIVKMLEETWFAKYMMTFGDDGGAIGLSHLPIYGVGATNDDVVRSVKTKTRGLWRMFTRNVISFRRGIMNQETLKCFGEFLELQHRLNVDVAVEKNNLENGLPPRIAVNNRLIHTEKLVSDLAFWSEVGRYKDFADAVVLCAKLGNYTKDDELIVVKKAKTIVDCFLDSQIPPKVQVNINPDLAENVIQLVQNGIIERGLFHEAALSTFSTLIYFWKKFCLHRFLPVEKKPVAKKVMKVNRSAQIIAKQKYLKTNKAKKVTLPPEDECSRLMFSLQLGLRVGLPKSLLKKRLGSSSEIMTALLSEEPLSITNEIFPISEI